MDSPSTKRIKSVLLLIPVMACMALPGYSRKPKAKKEKDSPTLKLERAIEHFQQASSLYGQKKLDDAIAEYQEALKGDPQEPYWHQALGKALEDKGDLQGALKEDWVAAKQSPLDSGLRSKYEDLARKLQVNIGSVNVETKPAEAPQVITEAFKPGAGLTPPIPTYKPEPPYADKARDAKYQGTTVLLVTVDLQGNVIDTKVVKPLGVGMDENALETVRTWRFKPATRGGVPIPARVYVEITFRAFF